ncbi:YggS family pyridoxal phosphate-dependent enzyme [Clostridium sediminicola]|uniref:YggS family pyridoxal phosphate-dependent enzyme n=1 Tax=Clostridium sediminicola TaxID=3114879 RepID=UPI0031F22D1C
MTIEKNLININKVIEGKEAELIAVSKTRTIEEMESVYRLGIKHFGENKVQDFTSKYEVFHKDVKWHFIGHLQKNKVKYIVGKVFLIHSLDSIKLLKEIEKKFSDKNEIANVLIQVNISKDIKKWGIFVEDLDEIIKECEKCKNVKVKGLMTVIPKGNEESCQQYFSLMEKLFYELGQETYKNIEMKYLSMGMTGDYKYAVNHGANLIRIGEGIFGKRVYNK